MSTSVASVALFYVNNVTVDFRADNRAKQRFCLFQTVLEMFHDITTLLACDAFLCDARLPASYSADINAIDLNSLFFRGI
jgi:hypothetical protein